MNKPASGNGIGYLLQKHMPGYERRPEQDRMAEAVAHALDAGRHLIVEAGTGVGKSLAYLMPLIGHIMKAEKRGVVSTYTKALQRQLAEKELPFLKRKLFPDLKFCLSVGGENYICLRRFGNAGHLGLFDPDDADAMQRLSEWASVTKTGLRMEVDAPASLWAKVMRESDNCRGKDCAKYRSCHYQKARERERQSHLLIVNHHLYFANVSSGGRTLPEFDCAVFDEAHHIEDVASDYLGIEVSDAKMRFLCDTLVSRRGGGLLLRTKWLGGGELTHMSSLVESVRAGSQSFFGRVAELIGEGKTIRFRKPPEIKDTVSDSLTILEKELSNIREISKDDDERAELNAIVQRAKILKSALDAVLSQEIPDSVYWACREGRRLALYATPVDVSASLREGVFGKLETAVLTSATLATGGSFTYIKERTGLDSMERLNELMLKSPFDYKRQALLYIGRDLPAPNAKEYEDALVGRISEILRITGGRTLVLFTSFRMMERAARDVNTEGIDILMQGESDSYTLLENFRSNPNSALFGTYTFWQGIDLPGDELKCVVITKLPFAVPDEPVIEARMESLEKRGIDPFTHYQIPQAAILLKQGFGRLIRTKDDAGIVCILDPRIYTKTYGRRFLSELPDCGKTTSLKELEDFYLSLEEES